MNSLSDKKRHHQCTGEVENELTALTQEGYRPYLYLIGE